MPGSSLWLLPPHAHPLDAALAKLIAQTAAQFGSPHTFLPHVTLTSDIAADVYTPTPQTWLDSLPFPPASSVTVALGPLASDTVYVRKLYSHVSKPGVQGLTRAARAVVQSDTEELESWMQEKWMPHLSLLYHDCAVVGGERMGEVEGWVRGCGVSLVGEGESGGWTGGRVVLVDTSRPIGEWVAIAEREL